jgi:hypothetical protein
LFVKTHQGLIWGLGHPEEASALVDKQRQRLLENLPRMREAGLDVHSPETLAEFAEAVEESVNSFQTEVRSLAEIPSELLAFQPIKARIDHVN